MCSGCKGFFAKSYKSRHQLICPAGSSLNLMMPLVPIEMCTTVEEYSDGFKALLNTLQLDEVGSYIKTDSIILMIGNRSFSAFKKKERQKN